MRNQLITIILASFAMTSIAQDQPKLIVGVVVDQMRTDYIYRYWDKFSDDGFKRLIKEGFFCRNAHFNYVPTYTAPGHASIYTGTTPMNHGIISNQWLNKADKSMQYCVSDKSTTSVGTKTEAGAMSPRNLMVSTLGDAIRTSSQFRGKSLGVSIKDRGAILPAGHSANACYWMDYDSGKMVSSDYYMDKLPKWVKTFNNDKVADELAKDGWNTLLAIQRYSESTEDNTPFERTIKPKEHPTFPYDLQEIIKENGYYGFASSPFGNTLLRRFAEQAIIHEDLGQDDHMDMLAISFSSPDMIGHYFGPQSIEVEDTYLRLDHEIAQLLEALDNRIGTGNYLLFLTADHAAAQVPNYLLDNSIPAGYIENSQFLSELNAHLSKSIGEGDWVLSYSNHQVFLNHELIKKKNLNIKPFYEEIESFSLSHEGVARVINRNQLQSAMNDEFVSSIRKGWNIHRSGDVMVQYLPNWTDFGLKGTTHGTSYNYDTHVPIIFFGSEVNQGESVNLVEITQIVPTICLMSSIAFPDASDKRPVAEAIE